MSNLHRFVSTRRQSGKTWKYLEALELRSLLSAVLPTADASFELVNVEIPAVESTPASAGAALGAHALSATPLVLSSSTTLTLTLLSGGAACAPATFHVAATGSPSGIVDLLEGNVWRASATMTNGSVDLAPTFTFHGGTHTLTAYFHGDSTHTAASSAPLAVNFTALPTTTTLTTSLATASELQPVTLTATVTSTMPTIGKVTFYDQGTALGTAIVNFSGKATLSYRFTNYGTHAITAQYAGVPDLAASVSSSLSEVILRTPRQLALRATSGTYAQSVTTVAAGASFDLSVSELDCNHTLFQTGTCSVALSVIAANAGGSLSGTKTAQAVNGVATFSGLSFTKPGTYTVRATDGSTLFGDLASIVVTPPATHLGFVAATSSSTIAGQVMAPVSVQFLDASNHPVPMNAPVTIALTKASGATLAGTTTVNSVLGTAIFNNLSLTQAGSYTLSATAGNVHLGTSKSFTILPEAASAHLVIATQPANIALDKSLAAITVNVVDQFNNLVTTDASTMTLAIASGPQGATLAGTTSVKAVKGVAKFIGITPQQVGDYTLRISDGAMTPVTTSSVNVAFVPTKLAVTPPTDAAIGLALPSFTVNVMDAKGRTVTTSSALVTLSVTSPSGAVVHGTLTATAVHGVASFSGLTVDAAGTYTFKLASNPLTAATLRLVV